MDASLKKEGITAEYLKSIDMSIEYSPVQLMPNEEPVKLIRCSTGYWVMLEFGEYLKDEKRRLVVIPEKEAKIGRARYLLNFKEEIATHQLEVYESKIQSEITRLKEKVDIKVKEDLSKLRQILVMGGKIVLEGLEAILATAIETGHGSDPFSINYRDRLNYEQAKEKAIELATDEMLDSYNSLKNLSETGQYDILYQHYFQDGLPLLASFKHNSPGDQVALVKNFHRDKIMETIDQIQSNGHLYMVAKFNVDKRVN